MSKIAVKPIGIVKNDFNESTDPFEIKKHDSRIIVDEAYAEGLLKIEHSEYIDVIFHFHLADEYKLVTNIYTGEKKGVFASRSPRRPSTIGSTTCRLLGREGNILYVTGLDALNNSPVLDLKPVDNSYMEDKQDRINFSRIKANPRINIISAVRGNDLEKLLVHAGELHGHFCPGLAIGVITGAEIMKNMAERFNEQLDDFSIEMPFCSCLVDGVQYVTGCTSGNRRLNWFSSDEEIIRVYYKKEKVLEVLIKPKDQQNEALKMLHPFFDGQFEDLFCKVNRNDEEEALRKKVLTDAAFSLVNVDTNKIIEIKELL